MKPNVIERLEEITAAIDRCQSEITPDGFDNPYDVMAELNFIDGVAGEILTMIDGR